jgi:hypothetical protein
MAETYNEADVERFMRDALEAAANRCEQMAATCKESMTTATDEAAREWLRARAEAARDLAYKIRALEVRRKG